MNDEIPPATRDYFALRLLRLKARVSPEGAAVDIANRQGRVVKSGYGTGATVSEAAQRAMERYLIEQEAPDATGVRERWRPLPPHDIG